MRVRRLPGARCLTIRLGSEGPPIHCHAARSRRERLLGIGDVPEGAGVLLAGRSAHGFHLDRPLDVVGIGREGTVVTVRRLDPGGVVVIAGATHLVEIPVELGSSALAPGERVFLAAPVVCPHARDALCVRNADREPR